MSDDLDRADNTKRLSVLCHKVDLNQPAHKMPRPSIISPTRYHSEVVSFCPTWGCSSSHFPTLTGMTASKQTNDLVRRERGRRGPALQPQPATRRATTLCYSFLEHVSSDSATKNGSSKRWTAAFICLFRLKLKQWTACLMRAPSLITSSGELEEIFSWNDSVRSRSLVHAIPSPDQTPWKISWLLINWLQQRGGRQSKRAKYKKNEKGERERERKGNQARSLLVPPVHILPLIPVLLYPLHLKQGCLLWAKTWVLLDHLNWKLTHAQS